MLLVVSDNKVIVHTSKGFDEVVDIANSDESKKVLAHFLNLSPYT
jgi:hypothetical protein